LSLLLDALKRAEQEKLARQPGGAVSDVAAPRAAANAAALELQPIGTQGPPGAHATHPAAHSAQNVFHAKAANAPTAAPRNRTMLWVALGAIGLVGIAAAGYVWYSVQALTPQYAGTPRPRPAPTPPPASGLPATPTAAMGSFVPPASTATAAVTTAAHSNLDSPTSTLSSSLPVAPPPPATAAERIVRDAASVPAPPNVQLERTATPPRSIPAGIASGYEALRLGDLAAARRGYESALATDPANLDAHLGIATIAAREGNRLMAVEYYRRALALDPRNATALAGLSLLADAARPEALEAQLRAEVLRSPESPALHFALGNLYASQSRWTDAQAAYYEAHRLDPGSADIAHNLAVSLDRLGQSKLAAGFYRRALEASSGRAAQFDPLAVTRRLEELR
jgi:tetratricopeptide (TPR) repeat protein